MRLFISSIFVFLFSIQISIASEIKQILSSDEPLLSKKLPDGSSKGLFVDFFQIVAKNAGREVSVSHLPWKRAQKIAQEVSDATLGPLTRTSKRESKYKWIGPLFPMRITYMTTLDQPVVENLDQARRLKVAIKGGSAAVYASKKHQLSTNMVDVVSQQSSILEMLIRKRIDAWLVWDVIAHRTVQEFDSGAQLQAGYTDELGELYMAASPSVSDEEIAVWRKAMEQAIKDGALKEITSKYLGRAYTQNSSSNVMQ
ncbi:substrate-binding periplasmic protein [Curvivirga aplysinae]|uniref:substrate-binding periplasmic protein n=1 Tax=Curvivirga aplysinae TaxID=2529852 RepID=UPI0012BC004D|nr:transporter substrate-binding domain-containing protein [Curvivirga aplysinae]MTI10942.1 transporter substrate-binding domain-containing protein [Curvivirga aplysinae]